MGLGLFIVVLYMFYVVWYGIESWMMVDFVFCWVEEFVVIFWL